MEPKVGGTAKYKGRKQSTRKRVVPPSPNQRWYNKRRKLNDDKQPSASARKMQEESDFGIPRTSNLLHCIINFFLVFTTLSNLVQCKVCLSDVKFDTCNVKGLGFHIRMTCECPDPVQFPASTYTTPTHTYDINRRFLFVMRLLGLGLKGCEKFCGLMEMYKMFESSTYTLIIRKAYDAAKVVAERLCLKAVNEEIEANRVAYKGTAREGQEKEFYVSGDGTWKKRGFSSLLGVAVLIANRVGKVIDYCVRSSYCGVCNYFKSRLTRVQFDKWYEEHKKTKNCKFNHEGSAGSMEGKGMVECYKRSVERGYVLRYYIGDGDAKTIKDLIEFYESIGLKVEKIECVGHVQKRMGTRLRALKKEKKGTKGMGGKGQGTLKESLIKKLTVHYGLAIRRHCKDGVDSVKNMYNAIWATYYHYSSTDKNPQHHLCPPGSNSWCQYQRAVAARKHKKFKHKEEIDGFNETVKKEVKTVYEGLSKEELLNRCVGGFTQNNNESLNQLIWKIAPKSQHSGLEVVQFAADVAASVFNEGEIALLLILKEMGIQVGEKAFDYVHKTDEARIQQGEKRGQAATREGRVKAQSEKARKQDEQDKLQEQYYGAGIA